MSVTVTSLEDAKARPRSLALGFFDGVHLGHREVIAGCDTALTFEPHPLRVLRPEAAPKLITPFEIKSEAIGRLGVEEIVVIPFDREFSSISAERFVDEILIGKLGTRNVSVGENLRFGTGAAGDPALLEADPRLAARVVGVVELDGEPVSSTRIRNLIEAGEIETANRCLGSPYLFQGTVVGGERRGRELGFPTANLVPGEELVRPGNGVYAALANGMPAAVSVGVRPTFEDDGRALVEAHLIDAEIDLYDRPLRIAFLAKLRDELRFDGADPLVEQMHRDVEAARRVCATFIAEFGTEPMLLPDTVNE